MKSADNPFAALLSQTKSGIDKQLIEEVLLFTLKEDQSPKKYAVLCLADVVVSDSGIGGEMGEELLSHALFERLMLEDTTKYLVRGENVEDALQLDSLLYLHRSYLSCEKIKSSNPQRLSDCDKIVSLIITNSSTCMRQPDLFPGRPVWEQWKEIMLTSEDVNTTETMNFIVECVQKIYNDDEHLEALGALKSNFYPLLGKIQTDISQSNLVSLRKNIFWILSFFVRDKRIPQMGEVLIDYTMPNPNTNGKY